MHILQNAQSVFASSHSSSYCCSRTFHALISKTPYSLSPVSNTHFIPLFDRKRSVMASDSGDNIETKQRQQLPQLDQRGKLPCPRCTSTNTKFCYFNNYNLSQPRHFCKSCRRYWTQGGTLRNIPIGGGTRKTNKRPRSSPQSELASSFSSVLSEPFMEKAGEVGFNFGLNEMGFGFGRLFWTMENTDELVDNVFSMPEPAIFNPGKGFE